MSAVDGEHDDWGHATSGANVEAAPIGLSAAGEARRGEILAVLLRAQTTRRAGRVRRARLTAALGCVALGVAATMTAMSLRGPRSIAGGASGDNGTVPGEVAGPAPTSEPPGPIVRILGNDPTILDRTRVVAPPLARFVDDDTLIEMLAAAGQPSGIVRVDGRATLAAVGGSRRTAESTGGASSTDGL